MRLATLVRNAVELEGITVRDLIGDPEVDVTEVVADSRQVVPGALFCCVPGSIFDGHVFAAAAIEAGAVALLVERRLGSGVSEVWVDSSRESMGPLAAVFHGRPSRRMKVVGVTGTNGKTTVTHLIAWICSQVGWSSRTIGTLSGSRTTPEAPELQSALADLAESRVDVAAIEVSSHAMDLHRVDGTRFALAVFTNLGRDHLDHHLTLEEYFAAKARLFDPSFTDKAIVNTDDPYGRRLLAASKVPTRGISVDDLRDVEVTSAGSRFIWRSHRVELPLLGSFNVFNALAALESAIELGIDTADAAEALSAAPIVPGRLEPVVAPGGRLLVVDYAHTPDGLQTAIESVREMVTGRVILVFGCGGDRDAGKRPEMGRVADEFADVAILTDDNPRSEDPERIRAAVASGLGSGRSLLVEPDRRLAIRRALDLSREGDVVLVAGKGHEKEQIVGDERIPFDDVAEVSASAAELWGSNT